MPREITLGVYAQGRHDGAARKLNTLCSNTELFIDISALSDAATSVKIEQWGSTDNGATWRFLGGCTIQGGAAAAAQAISDLKCGFSQGLDAPLLRATVEVIGNPATIAVDSR